MLDNFVPGDAANAPIQGFRAWKATFYGIWGAHGERNQPPLIVDAIVADSRGALFNGGQGSGLRPMALRGVTLVKTTRNQPAERASWSEQRWRDFFHRFNSANDTFWTGITTYPRPRIDFANPTAPLQGYPAFIEFSNVQLLGWTDRDMRRHFARTIGCSPKYWLRLHRLSAVLGDRGFQHGRETLADTAAAFGFADQAHLAREFRLLAGMPPSAYQKRREVEGLDTARTMAPRAPVFPSQAGRAVADPRHQEVMA